MYFDEINRLTFFAKTLTFVVPLLVGLSGTTGYAQVETEPTTQLEFREVLSIGEDVEAPEEYLFSNPEHIRTDDDGRIYVAEQRRSQVRVFSAQGQFLGALGRSGRGPGEFSQVTAIALDSEERLVAYDRMLQRFIRFPPFEEIDSFPPTDPEQMETYPNPEEYRINPVFMYGLPGGRFVLFYQPLTDRSLDQPRLHVYDDSLDKVDAFGPPTEWKLPDDAVPRHQMKYHHAFAESHVAPGRSSLLLAPHFYHGTLHRYVPTGEGTWTLRFLDGRDPGHPTHTVLAHEVFSRNESPSPNSFLPNREPGSYSALSSSLPGGRQMISAYLPRSTTHGVGRLSDGRVLHLSRSEDEDGVKQLQLELFGPGGRLQDVGRIGGFVHEDEKREAVLQADLHLHWVDHRNRLYLVDSRSGFPILRVVKLEK